ncbi:polyphosphate kinase [Ditylenchus destructor]|uniref:Polyphosphate kinase n=1 Tax=Ditylenchus destructor TaxID=166010 RepID=A0AAD4QUU8_9BILA|nr:polyphosphate kinase [Ditylenchus destructor]
MTSRSRQPSGCCATATSSWRKRRRIWFSTSAPRSSGGGAGGVIRRDGGGHRPRTRGGAARELGGSEALLTETGGFLGVGDLSMIVEEDRPDLKFPPYAPFFPERVREFGGDCFAAIKAKDIVVHHPYETFDVVLAFQKTGGERPRCGGDQADAVPRRQTVCGDPGLIAAAEAGKSVTAVVELKARFDGGAESALGVGAGARGVQVIYGFTTWKTHAKVSMVVRREGDEFRPYCHFGTGTTTRLRRGSTPTSASSPRIRGWGAMRRRSSTTSPAMSSRRIWSC